MKFHNVLSFTTKKAKLFISTQVAKHGSPQKFVDTRVGSLCGECGELVTGIYCDTCNQRSLTCSVCRGHVMGLSVTCPKCGHGGHLKHFREWFTSRDYCPTNCSCNCALFLFPKSWLKVKYSIIYENNGTQDLELRWFYIYQQSSWNKRS